SVGAGLGSVRGVFTGANFDGTGEASIRWLSAPIAVNEWGLERYWAERARAASAERPSDRDSALARALLAAGAALHLGGDAGDPSFARNDYRVERETRGGPYERFVAARFGRLAIPAPASTPAPARFVELIHNEHGRGLADRTRPAFFSSGT